MVCPAQRPASPARALVRLRRLSPRAKGADGRPLREEIVARALAGDCVLGILPTGTGKSVCYQLPALSKYEKTGALTVVISPLVALMADQVDGLRRQGISSCVAINGLLSLPERHQALEQVRLGDAGILLISPEQLRSPRSARCCSSGRSATGWSMRPTASRNGATISVRTTATLRGSPRSSPATNRSRPPLPHRDRQAGRGTRHPRLLPNQAGSGARLHRWRRAADEPGVPCPCDEPATQAQRHRLGVEGAIAARRQIGCGRLLLHPPRGRTRAGYLQAESLLADFFHAGLTPEKKREVQERFRRGELRVIAATSAFGMGIDKPDIRLVVHGDIPGSLESYLQEAGRAGRDRGPASCVLLFHQRRRRAPIRPRRPLPPPQREISAILKALRRLDHRLKRNGVVVVTPGEIVQEETEAEFVRDSATEDTRQDGGRLARGDGPPPARREPRLNLSGLPGGSVDRRGRAHHPRRGYPEGTRNSLLAIARALFEAPADKGVSTDELCGVSRLTASELRRALRDLERLRIATNDTAITAFIHVGVENASRKRLEAVGAVEMSSSAHSASLHRIWTSTSEPDQPSAGVAGTPQPRARRDTPRHGREPASWHRSRREG